MTELYEMMQKRAVVDKRVKQYRRSLQMLESGSHDWHGTANLQGVANVGELAPGPRAAMGSGVYFFEGKPNHGYWAEGGAAVPHAALAKSTRLPFNNALGEANLLSSGKVPLKPIEKAVAPAPLSPAQKLIQKRIDPSRFPKPEPGKAREHTYMFAEHGNQGALRDLQRKNHVRTVDVDVLNLARRSVSDWAKHHTDAPDGSGRGRLLQVLEEYEHPSWLAPGEVSVARSNRLSVGRATDVARSGSTIRPAAPLSAPKTPKWYLPYAHAAMNYGPVALGLALSAYGSYRHRKDLDAALKEYRAEAPQEEETLKAAFELSDTIPMAGALAGYGMGHVARKYVKDPYVAATMPTMGAAFGYSLTVMPHQVHRAVRDSKQTNEAFAQYLDRVRKGENLPSLKSREESNFASSVDGGRNLNKRITDLMMGRQAAPVVLTPAQRFQQWRTKQPFYAPASEEEQKIIAHLRADPTKPYRDSNWSTLMEMGVLAPVTEWHKMYAPKTAQVTP